MGEKSMERQLWYRSCKGLSEASDKVEAANMRLETTRREPEDIFNRKKSVLLLIEVFRILNFTNKIGLACFFAQSTLG